MSTLSEQECQNELFKNIDLNICLFVENKVEPSSDECWTRCLKHLPVLIFRYINLHRLSSGNDKSTVIFKTLETGRKFKSEGYLSLDSIFTKRTKNTFTIEAKCSASLKTIKKDVVTLARKIFRAEKV